MVLKLFLCKIYTFDASSTSDSTLAYITSLSDIKCYT